MARIGNYSNTQKYIKRKSFDGSPVESGQVLVPFRKDQYGLNKGDYIQDNFTTMHLGEFSYEVGFMQIDEAYFETYMRGFWAELNEDMKMRREGRCIIGKNPDGSDKLCPFTRRCTGCPEKGLLERYNQKRIEILSIGSGYDGKIIDIEDISQPSVEDQVLNRLCPEPTEDELKIKLMAHFNEVNPRYAKIICLRLEGKSIEDICVEIKLKPSRGRQEINNAHDAVCEYLRLRHYRKNHK